MVTLALDNSITLSQQHLTCVLDPNLVLSKHGLPLIQHLGDRINLWIARELLHVFDNIHFYLQHPELMLAETTSDRSHAQITEHQSIIRVLQDWYTARRMTDPANLKLFWIGDRLGESYLPRGSNPQLFSVWELLARSLDLRSQTQALSSEILTATYRDTVALAAALGSAFILTCQPSSSWNHTIPQPPDLCIALEQWGIPCQFVQSQDAMVAIEREILQHLIIAAGCSRFLWTGLHLAVLHLVVPSASSLYYEIHPIPDSDLGSEPALKYLINTPDLWEGATGIWYWI
jgi:hypothetical protein